MLEIRELYKRFGGARGSDGKVALDGVSFAVRPGEMFGFVGANGAGSRQSVDTLATHRTERGDQDPDAVVRDLEDLYARRLNLPSPAMRTAHSDLHWANLTAPRLWILDWEYWGTAPTGYGAALLYYHSLLVPETAEKVRKVFADLLDAPSGHVAQLSAAAHILGRAYRVDDYTELQHPVRKHAHRLLDEAEMP